MKDGNKNREITDQLRFQVNLLRLAGALDQTRPAPLEQVEKVELAVQSLSSRGRKQRKPVAVR